MEENGRLERPPQNGQLDGAESRQSVDGANKRRLGYLQELRRNNEG